jgi:protein O-GlcNAc transferase
VASVADIFALAMENHQAGQLPLAEQLYQQVLRADPLHAGAHHLLGALAYQTKQFDRAVASIRQAIALQPDAPEYHLNIGLAYAALGQWKEAAASFQRAVALQPVFAEARANLGNALLRLGQEAQAIDCYAEALRQNPNHAEAHCNLGVALANREKTDEALEHWRRAVQIWPDYPEAHNNLGFTLQAMGQPEAAEWHCREALRCRPHFAEAHNNLANAFLDLGKREEAASHCRQALRLSPGFPEAHYNLAIALRDLGRTEEAVDSLKRALHFRPDFPQALTNLGDIYLKLGMPEQALASFKEALRLHPNLGPAQRNLLFYANYDPHADLDAVYADHCSWGRSLESATSPLPCTNDQHPERRLRIGYVSPDLRAHALTRYLEPVLAHHDPQQVEVFCYAEVAFPDAVTSRLQGMVQGWRSTCHRSDEQVAQQISEDRIDILVDLAGHTCNSRLSVFALKPAPVQATWLGYLNTSGLTRMDYRLTDEVLDPSSGVRCPVSGVGRMVSDSGHRTPDSGHIYDTEELLRLPGGMCCFAPPEDAPEMTPLPALRMGNLMFGSVHNLFKLNPTVFELWSKLLKALPTARLLMYRDSLTPDAQVRIRRQFAELGIGPERLDLRRAELAPGYLKVYAEIDISLDSFPYTGGVTTCESLWMGAPVISLKGMRPAGRNSAAILSRVGLAEWAVDTPEAYLAFAASLADDLDRIATLRAELRDRMRSSLCDAGRFTRELEDAYRTIWRRWCSQRHGPRTEQT